MSDSSHTEVDSRIILQDFSCVHSGLKDIYVQTNDMDVVVILVTKLIAMCESPSCLELDLTLVAYL